MSTRAFPAVSLLLVLLTLPSLGRKDKEQLYLAPLATEPRPVAKDSDVKLDYPIVYVRAPRDPKRKIMFAEANLPVWMDPGADLVVLHPDGKEVVLVEGGTDGSVADPFVSFDAQWVYYAHFRSIRNLKAESSDIYKVHVKSKKIVRLTHQEYTPNTGVVTEAKPRPVFNLGPCPLPGGRVVFVSSRNGFVPPRSYAAVPVLQLFTMHDDGANVELIAPMNLAGALHPVILKDGRVMFSTAESQGLRGTGLWGLWAIRPDGTSWEPLLSAFNQGSVDQITHFQTQLGDGSIVIEEYYNQNNWGFGSYYKFPLDVPADTPRFGPAYLYDPRNVPLRQGRYDDNGRAANKRLSFSPHGIESLTPFTHPVDRPAPLSVRGDAKSARVGKFTHPSGAPDNHLLTVYSPGPVNHNGVHLPIVDAGLYLIKKGKAIDEPGQLVLIKNDPKFNEQWPRALVPYQRIYGVEEPKNLPRLKNDGKLSPNLPEGTPFGLVGTSSFYKRETYPNGRVPQGSVTAEYPRVGDRSGYEGLGAFNPQDEYGAPLSHWGQQGAEAGKYDNADIHAVRILVMEPTSDRRERPRFFNFARERLRILGEIPVRKFPSPQTPLPKGGERGRGEGQPLDPDGNPDTSFLAKIPADTPFTFQTIDKDGMVLNSAQTWHQVRPGEIRHDCGGCHAHSQLPTPFEKTAAAKKDYPLFDLTQQTPLVSDRSKDRSGKTWDVKDQTGLRYDKKVKDVEFYRDVKPILDRSCVACHTHKWQKPAGNLVLDDEELRGADFPYRGSVGKVSGTYFRLVLDHKAQHGHKPLIASWRGQPSRYLRMFQSRRSLLVWKAYGRRTDGWSNDDFPTETTPGDAKTLQHKGKPVSATQQNIAIADLDYTGTAMPPPDAIKGTYRGPDGKAIQVPDLGDEDRRTLARWIDLGCPIDLDFDPKAPQKPGLGWMCDDTRPTLTLTHPAPGRNAELARVVVGMTDYNTGLDAKTFRVVADFAVDGQEAGTNLASSFREKGGVWEMRLKTPLTDLKKGKLTVEVKDRQGNVTRIERTFSVGP